MITHNQNVELTRLHRLIGDSLTQAHWHVLKSLLWTGIDDDSTLIHRKDDTLFINPRHPDAFEIIRKAGVSEDRTRYPIVTFRRTDLVLTENELRQSFSHALPRLDLKPGKNESWLPELMALLDHPFEMTKRGVLEEPTIMVSNIGPHWSIFIMGKSLWTDDLALGYRRSVSLPSSLQYRSVLDA